MKWDHCSEGWKGPCCVGLLLQCSIGKCFFSAFYSLHVCHLAVPHLWVAQHRVSGQVWMLTLLIYKTMWMKSIQRFLQKHLMFVPQRPLFPFKLEKSFCLFFPPMEMVMQAKKNVINNTNWGPLGGNFSFEKWLLCMNMSCHQKFICIVLTLHICIYFSSARHSHYPYLNRL